MILNKYNPLPPYGGIPKGDKPKKIMEVKGFWKNTSPETIDGEVWRIVKGYEAYMISNYGRIRTCDHVQQSRNRKTYRICSGQIVRQSLSGSGYLKVHLYGKNGRRCFNVHRLVAKTFVNGYAPGLVVNHLNEIKTDNRASNLEWCTPKENTNYGTAPQRRSESLTNNPKRSNPVEAFSNITGEWIATFPSQREAARQMKCALATIQRAINRQNRAYKGLIFISL